MSTDLAIAILGLLLASVAIAPFVVRMRRMEKRTLEADRRAHDYGLKEPATLHPVINPEVCIGTGNCIKDVCPENVLGIRDGQAYVITPASCIGHGLCERACPVEAISLVFGTEKRGVDIPRIDQNFETNVPGIFIIGELGGMGLIGNAFEQGRQCVDGISKTLTSRRDILDAVVVGCGPAGLSASITATHNKLNFATIEKEDIGGTVRYFPRKKLVMTKPLKIPGYGKVNHKTIVKEDLESLWEDIVHRVGLEVATQETVISITRSENGHFLVQSDQKRYITQTVILAIGRRGVPRKLEVPGEDDSKVAYSLREPEAFQDSDILVVGGGDSAVEAALALSQQNGNRVTVSYRRDAFSRIKPMNRERINKAIEDRHIHVRWGTTVERIDRDAVHIRQTDSVVTPIKNDNVFVFIGGVLPTKFLSDCGIAIDTKFGTA
ncbi:MAG: NAD(P)-binding domain-containing protein [Rhodothermales bacterium]|nr:NAD(P)-binding domain-containing protein [Rhodothermales bacterium]